MKKIKIIELNTSIGDFTTPLSLEEVINLKTKALEWNKILSLEINGWETKYKWEVMENTMIKHFDLELIKIFSFTEHTMKPIVVKDELL